MADGTVKTDAYATVDDVSALWKTLTNEQQEMARNLLPIVSDSLRMEAKKTGQDLDAMIENGAVYASVVKSVTVDIVSRYLENVSANRSSTLSQESQSALGYSWSGTYANTGGGISILNKDLKRLGLTRQRYGLVDLYGIAGD